MSDERINVVSDLPIAMRLQEPLPNPEKPGEAGLLGETVIAGKSHPDAPPMVTRDVSAKVFHAWMEANRFHPAVLNESIRVVSDEEADRLADPLTSYGFAPALAEAEDEPGEDAEPHDREVRAVPPMDTRREEPTQADHAAGPEAPKPETTNGARSAELQRATRP